MADVFISYAKTQAKLTEELAQDLEAKGFSTWWDTSLLPGDEFPERIKQEINAAQVVIVIWTESSVASRWVRSEAALAHDSDKLITVHANGVDLKSVPVPYNIMQSALVMDRDKIFAALERRGVKPSGKQPCGADRLIGHIFSYEKDIIKFYYDLYSHDERGEDLPPDVKKKLDTGCPRQWPKVDRQKLVADKPNRLIPSIGTDRPDEAYVSVSALQSQSMDRPIPDEFRFPEAGPRLNICFPQKKKYQSEKKLNVAILVSGGIAPGINAVIDGIVQRHWLYATGSNEENYELSIYGLINGISASYDFHNSYKFLVDRHKRRDSDRDREMETSNHAHEGGSILGTSRDNTLLIEADRNARLKEFVDALNARHIDILYVIGGDGSMRMAHALHQHALNSPSTDGNILSVVAVPKTMDNDILWVWQTFGFMSAVEKAREIIELVHTEITSNPRLGIVQLFGSVSGFVVSHAVLASSAPSCYLALVPEVPFELQKVAEHLWKRIEGVPSGLIVMAETALPKDYKDILNELDEPILSDKEMNEVEEFSRLQECGIARPGQTSDELRSACLKIVRHGLEHLLKHGDKKSWGGSKGDWSRLRMLTNEPRHIIRAIPPSSQDIINCRRLGSLAVDNAMAGYRDFMISQWLTEFVLVPLPLVTLGRKQIHKNGVFWKAVLAKTGSLELFEGTPSGAS